MDRGIVVKAGLVAAARIVLLGIWFLILVRTYAEVGRLADGLAEAAAIALALAAIKAVVGALGDPLDMEALRRLPLALRESAEAFALRLADRLRLRLAVAALTALVAAASGAAAALIGAGRLAETAALVGLAAAAELVYRGFLNAAQAREDFRRLVALEASLQGLRAVLLGGLALAGWLDARAFLLAYAAAAGIVACLAHEPHLRLFDLARASRAEIAGALGYLRWTVPAMALAAVVERLDVFLLGALRPAADTGPYGAILPLVMIPEVVAGFAMTVLQPRIPVYAADGRLLRFWRGIVLLAAPCCLAAFAVIAAFAEPLVRLTVGPAYLAAAPALVILSAGTLFWLAFVPVAQGFVMMIHPRATFLVCLAQAAASVVMCVALIPSYGLVGAALAAASVKVAVGVALCAATLALADRPGRVESA